MSFSSFNLFNFYQQPNTGIFPIQQTVDVALVNGGNAASGTIADFNWYFPYATNDPLGRIPPAIFEGGFTLPILSDSDIGLHYGTINSSFSGNFLGTLDKTSMVFAFSGSWEPVITGFQNQVVIISGDTRGALIDVQSDHIIVSGNFLGFDADQSKCILTISGNIYQDFNINFIKLCNSGNIISGIIESCKNVTTLSGNFYALYGDGYNINYGFLGYSSETGGQAISGVNQIFVDTANITYMIVGYSKGNN